jgi:hypothetical protein
MATICDQLREAITASIFTVANTATLAGVDVVMLMAFLRGSNNLSSSDIDDLCIILKLKLVRK